jgi:glutamate racemase
MDPHPIGIFDSGIGGLSVVRALQGIAPNERILYFADTDWFPYGGRPEAEIRKRSFAIARKLIDARCKMIVVACNTASAAALKDLRDAFPVPFVGMVPGLKPAASTSRHVAVLATPGTLGGELYAEVDRQFASGARVVNVPGGNLAGIVERGEAGTDVARDAIRSILGPAVASGADTVVLGCTHYAFLTTDIAAEFPGIAVVDTSDAVARHAINVLKEAGLEAPPDQQGGIDLIVSGDREAFRAAMASVGFESAAAEVAS